MAATDKPYIILRSGHTDATGGNAVERQKTPALAAAYLDEGRKRGYRVDWYNASLDGDSDPRGSAGNLTQVALGIGRVLESMAKNPLPSILLDLHYDGGSAPIEAIAPGIEGWGGATLRPAVGIAPPGDLTKNNVLDLEIGAAWAAHTAAATGYRRYAGGWGVPGIMMERETGVGRQGYRLAIFGATAHVRQTAARLVLEHGGTSDRHADNAVLWARAALDAIDEVVARRWSGSPPSPNPDVMRYRQPVPPVFWDALVGTEGATAARDGDTTWYRTSSRYVARRDTPRQQFAVVDSRIVGPPIPEGTEFTSVAVGQSATDGQAWVITPWLTRVRLDDLAYVGPAVE